MAGKKWVAKATRDKGALHRNLGVPEGEKIPEDKLDAATRSKDATIRKEANLAKTLKGFHHKAKKSGHSAKEARAKMYGAKD